MEIRIVIKNKFLVLIFCLTSSLATSQDYDLNYGFVDSIFLSNVYKSVIESTFVELQNSCSSLKKNDIRINENLWDSIPIFRDLVVLVSEDKRLIDFDRADSTLSHLKNPKNKVEDFPNFLKPFEGINYNKSFQTLHTQNRQISIEGCKEHCPIELSLSVLSIQNDIIEGYINVTIKKEGFCSKNFEDPIVFHLDDWDNLIVTRVSKWWKSLKKLKD